MHFFDYVAGVIGCVIVGAIIGFMVAQAMVG